MAWSDAAREAARQARRLHAQVKVHVAERAYSVQGPGNLASHSGGRYYTSPRLATAAARINIAKDLKAMRAGTFKSKNSYTRQGAMAVAVRSTNTRNYLRRVGAQDPNNYSKPKGR